MRAASLLLLVTMSVPAFAVCPMADVSASGIGVSIVTGDTRLNDDDYTPACGVGTVGSGDAMIEFTAPMSGTYQFTTSGSSFDTTLSVVSTADCTTSLQCNDDAPGVVTSSLSRVLTVGEVILLVVDGYAGATGAFGLNVNYTPPATCAVELDLGSRLGTAIGGGTTCGAADNFNGAACAGGQSSEDISFLWTAPATGTFVAHTIGSSYDTAMTLRGENCAELGCDDDTGGNLTSQIVFTATAGQHFTIVVDGFGSGNCGDYLLSVEEYVPCDDADLDGLCDANDLCYGVDVTGDSDADGICDNLDFHLTNGGAPVAGQPFTLGVYNAPPGATVYFLATGRGMGQGPCTPNGAACSDLIQPTILGSRTVGAGGGASITITPPAALRGRTAYFQAAWVMSNEGDTTEVDSFLVQ